MGGGGRAGLGGRRAPEPPGEGAGEPVWLTPLPFGTMTHSSDSLEGDGSRLDLQKGMVKRSLTALRRVACDNTTSMKYGRV